MRTDYTYETTRAAILRLGMGPVWEMAIEEDRVWNALSGPPRFHDPALPGERESREQFRVDMDSAEDSAEWWDAHGWDLLLDYDRIQDVPGALQGAPFTAFDALSVTQPAWRTLANASCVIACIEAPPNFDELRTILAARLERAGYAISGWEALASTNGWHVKVRLQPSPASPIETVALQAICGSDPLRESCNIERARTVQLWLVDADRAEPEAADFWRKRWNVLYEANPERVKV